MNVEAQLEWSGATESVAPAEHGKKGKKKRAASKAKKQKDAAGAEDGQKDGDATKQ